MNSNDIQRSLGRLEAKVDTLLSERKDEKKQLAIIERKQDTAEKDRTAMAERLKEVEKNTADFNRWKERGVGALMLISAIAALIGGTLATSWQKILDIFK